MDIPKLQLCTYTTTLSENKLKTSTTALLQLKIKKKKKDRLEGQRCGLVRIHTLGVVTHKWERLSQLQKPSLMREGLEPHVGCLSPEDLHWDDEPL